MAVCCLSTVDLVSLVDPQLEVLLSMAANQLLVSAALCACLATPSAFPLLVETSTSPLAMLEA
jgi:hypothetical protein